MPRLRKMPSINFGEMPAGMPPEETRPGSGPRSGGSTEAGCGFGAGNGTAAVAPLQAAGQGAVAAAWDAAGGEAGDEAGDEAGGAAAAAGQGGVITSADEGRDAEYLLQAAKMAALKQLYPSRFEVATSLIPMRPRRPV